MIFEFIVGALLGAIQTAVDAVLPVGSSEPFSVSSGFFIGYSWLDSMFPIHVVFQIAIAWLAVRAVLFLFRLAVTVYHLIPVIG